MGQKKQKIEHSRSEASDGKEVQGSYKLRLPDGRIQTVTYTAGVGGFKPVITYEGHSSPVTDKSYDYEADAGVIHAGVVRGGFHEETTESHRVSYLLPPLVQLIN